MKNRIIIIASLIAALIGMGAILPALAKVRDLGAMPGALVGSYTLGVFLLTLVCGNTVCWAVRRRKT